MKFRPTKAERELRREMSRERPVTKSRSGPPAPAKSMPPVPVVEWQDMYSESWRGIITPESFAHPAKMARALVRRIYDELFALGMPKGATILDPFGGVGTTAIEGTWRGCQVVCVELEPKFVALAKDNFAQQRWTNVRRPIFIQGDSRQLQKHLANALTGERDQPIEAIVSSPPFGTGDSASAQSITTRTDKSAQWIQQNTGSANREGYGASPGQMAEMTMDSVDAVISSPPYEEIATGAGGLNTLPARTEGQQTGRAPGPSQTTDARYGATEGQLARMEKGSVDAIVSSPPYADALNSPENGIDQTKTYDGKEHGGQIRYSNAYADRTEGQLGAMKAGNVDAIVSSPPYAETLLNDDQRQAGKGEKLRWGTNEEYGTSPGQLGTMKEHAGVDAVVSSPPYAEGGVHDVSNEVDQDEKERSTRAFGSPLGSSSMTGYGNTPGQLAREDQVTFWHAAKDIVANSYAVLKPGGYAVWVVKKFIRNRQIVDFPADWRKLCEYCGFETLTEVRAMFTKELGTHTDLVSQEPVTTKKERKSFFRRLAEKKGSPRIDHETIWIMRKPL